MGTRYSVVTMSTTFTPSSGSESVISEEREFRWYGMDAWAEDFTAKHPEGECWVVERLPGWFSSREAALDAISVAHSDRTLKIVGLGLGTAAALFLLLYIVLARYQQGGRRIK